MPFRDVLVTSATSQGFQTTVYKQPTDTGMYFNSISEFMHLSIQAKSNTQLYYTDRILKFTSTWTDFHTQINLMKQT